MPCAAEFEARLLARTFFDSGELEPAGDFVMPSYDGLGIANLPATIAALFGRDLPGACPPLEADLWADWSDGLRRVILVLVDALGYRQLQAAIAADGDMILSRLAAAGALMPITSTFPSTTNNVLTTLWTGRSPAEHGVLAFELFLRELGVAASTLFFWPISYPQRDSLGSWGIDPDTFVPVPGLAAQFSAQGIVTRGFINKAYAESILSRIHRRGMQGVTPYVAGGDMWSGVQRTIEQHLLEKLFLMAYWDTVDGITHQVGPDDDAWLLEVRGLSWMLEHAFLSRLTPTQREGTLLILVADHGGVTTLPSDAVRLGDHPVLRDALTIPPVGESRVPFLHARPDRLADLRAYMVEELGEAFVTLTREQVLDSGLLGPGPVYAETPHRLGDLIGLARGQGYLARSPRQLQMLGRHGGLSAQEMLVPLLGVRLDRI